MTVEAKATSIEHTKDGIAIIDEHGSRCRQYQVALKIKGLTV